MPDETVISRDSHASLVRIVSADTPFAIGSVRMLFQEYSSSLGFDLDFQNFDGELAALPGDYTPPSGCLLLAYVDQEPAGCVALRRFDHGICEMKRLYVRPAFRGLHIGRSLAEAVIAEARMMGYTTMRLDTLASMSAARSLYRSLGFKEIAPYRFNPIDGAVYMECNLRRVLWHQRNI